MVLSALLRSKMLLLKKDPFQSIGRVKQRCELLTGTMAMGFASRAASPID